MPSCTPAWQKQNLLNAVHAVTTTSIDLDRDMCCIMCASQGKSVPWDLWVPMQLLNVVLPTVLEQERRRHIVHVPTCGLQILLVVLL